jgi:hypothetical protein
MRSSVQTAWPNFVTFYEGRLSWLYLDTKSLVTTGVGFLMDDGTGHAPDACLRLPWIYQGVAATRLQIGDAWDRVKARTDLAPRGGYAFQNVTTLRLPEQAIGALLTAKTLDFWSILSATLPALEQWPADAQLALMDMAWHMGPRFLGSKWPNFTAAAHAEDFAGMAEHCQTANRSPRDARHVRLFSNAAVVTKLGLDPERLWDDVTPKQEENMAERIPFRGGLTCSCVVESLPWVELDMIRRGIIKQSIDIKQLGYRDDVSASAGTHSRGGCVDVAQRSAAAIDVWRRWGWTMQDRSPWFPDAPHAHGWPYGCPHLGDAAKDQRTDWDNRRNGLVNNQAVIGRWPVPKWDVAIERIVPTLFTETDIAKKVLSLDNVIANSGFDPNAGNEFVALKTALESLGRFMVAQKKTNTDLAATLKTTNAKLDALTVAVQKLTPPPTPPPEPPTT